MVEDQIRQYQFPVGAIEICGRLHEHQFEAYIVGGAVRNALLKRPSDDVDIATSALPHQIESIFSNTKDTGRKFGTITVGWQYDGTVSYYQLTTFRVESDYSDNRHPDFVTFSSYIEDDLMRRDFTINAMAWCPINTRLIDINDGVTDLIQRRLQTVGKPIKRFSEDSLRLFRLCRFQAQLGFAIESDTLQAGITCADDMVLPSFERIQIELMKLVGGPYSWETLSSVLGQKLMRRIFPSLTMPEPLSQWPEWNALQRIAYLICKLDNKAEHLRKARFPNSVITDLMRLIENNLNVSHAQFQIKDLAISGNQLMDMGFKGRQIGQVLSRLRGAVLSGVIQNDAGNLLSFVRNTYPNHTRPDPNSGSS
jgi:tRNA nucleotidyltransferase (CCA-adding enzyme)